MKPVSYNQAYYHINKAIIEWSSKNLAELEKHSNKLKELKTTSNLIIGYYHFSRGMVSSLQGNDNEAKACLQEAVTNFKEGKNSEWLAVTLLYQSQFEPDFSKGIGLLSSALKIFTTLGDNIGYSKAIENMAIRFNYSGEYEKAIECFNLAIEKQKTFKDFIGEAVTFYNFCSLYYELGELQLALFYGQQAVNTLQGVREDEEKQFGYVWQTSGWTKAPARCELYLANAYINLGNVLKALGETTKAIEFYGKAEQRMNELGHKEGEAIVLNQIGEAFKISGDFENAEVYFKKSYDIFLTLNSQEAMFGTVVQGIAESLALQGKFELALEYYHKALEVFQQVENKKGVAEVMALLGELYIEKKEYRTAVKTIESGLEVAQSISIVGEVIRGNRLLGTALLKIDSQKAKEYLLRALILSEEHQFRVEEQMIHKALSSHYKLIGDSTQALLHYEKYHQIKEDLFTNATERTLKNIQIIHEVERYKHEIELSSKKIVLLESELDRKNRELSEIAIRILEKEEFIKTLEKGIQKIIEAKIEDKNSKLRGLLRALRGSIGIEQDKDEFGRQFMEVHRDYVNKLVATMPNITQQELRICALLRLSMNTKQIADLLNLSTRSVDNHRLRIRKKLGMPEGESITTYLLKMDTEN